MGSGSTRIIKSSSVANKPIREFIKFQQNGLCRQCGRGFDDDEPILSKSRGNRRYYHLECAKRLNII